MNNDIFQSLIKNFANLSKRIQVLRNEKINYVLFAFIFIIIASIVFTFNNSLKKKRLEEINSFISNNQTILLKNYLLNPVSYTHLRAHETR